MGSHPANLTLRFLLELSGLLAMSIWAWKLTDNWFRFILVFIIPFIAASIWGIFAVPDDPSRSGKAPVVIPGLYRLVIELAFFAFAVWTLYDLRFTRLSLIFGSLVIIHYMISYDRILWLIDR